LHIRPTAVAEQARCEVSADKPIQGTVCKDNAGAFVPLEETVQQFEKRCLRYT
jgi:hypothetical protein